MIVEELLKYTLRNFTLKIVESDNITNMLFKGSTKELAQLIEADKLLKNNNLGGFDDTCFLKKEVVEILPCNSEQMLMVLVK